MIKGVSGFAEHQKVSFKIGYKDTPRKNNNDAVLNEALTKPDASIKKDIVHMHLLHCTPSDPQQGVLYKKILSKTPTEIRCNQRSVFMTDVNDQNLWTFQLGSQLQMNVPIRMKVGFNKETD